MTALFADTFYWIALADFADGAHERALALTTERAASPIFRRATSRRKSRQHESKYAVSRTGPERNRTLPRARKPKHHPK